MFALTEAGRILFLVPPDSTRFKLRQVHRGKVKKKSLRSEDYNSHNTQRLDVAGMARRYLFEIWPLCLAISNAVETTLQQGIVIANSYYWRQTGLFWKNLSYHTPM